MVVDNKGQLFAVGWGKYGQLGLGDGETRSIPVPVCMPQKEPVHSSSCLLNHIVLASSYKCFFAVGPPCRWWVEAHCSIHTERVVYMWMEQVWTAWPRSP